MTQTEAALVYPPERTATVPCGTCKGTGERPDRPRPGQRWAMPECPSCKGIGELPRKHYAYCKRRECIGCLPTIEEIEQMSLLDVFAEMLARCIPQSPATKTHEGAVAVIRRFESWYHTAAYFARLHTFVEQDVDQLRDALQSARYFIAHHPAVHGDWPLVLEIIDTAVARCYKAE